MALRLASLLALLSVAVTASLADSNADAPITDEALRVAALRAVFPEMQVSAVPGRRIDDSWPKKKPRPDELSFPDALAGETVYRVTGKVMNEAEDCASSNITEPEKSSRSREVRFRLFEWPNENGSGLLAVLQYKFPAANPPMACPSMAILVHLVKKEAAWHARGRYLLETGHHYSVQRADLLDLAGGGVADHLVIESNYGGAAVAASGLQVFDLSKGRLDEVLSMDSRTDASVDGQELNMGTLDVDRTRETHGQQFCTIETTLIEKGKRFNPPRITKGCFKLGLGVDRAHRAWATERNKELAPLPPR